jgi:branched-chain amino acid transport system permease protein
VSWDPLAWAATTGVPAGTPNTVPPPPPMPEGGVIAIEREAWLARVQPTAAIGTVELELRAGGWTLGPLPENAERLPLVSAIGVSFIFMNIGLFWLGPADRSFPELLPATNLLAGEGLQFTAKDLLVIVVVVPLMIALSVLVKTTRLGKAMRAVSQDPTAAALVGIDVDRVIAATFFVGGFLGGAASVIYGLYINTIGFQMGFQNGLYAFTAAVLGGIGSIPGAVVGGIVIGLVRALSSAYVGERWTGAIVFAILIVILVFRPEGLLGRGTKEKV